MTSYPFVYWAQDEERVFLSVDLRDATPRKIQNTDYSLSGNVFEFRSIGTGAQGRREYCFELDLFDDVSTDKACSFLFHIYLHIIHRLLLRLLTDLLILCAEIETLRMFKLLGLKENNENGQRLTYSLKKKTKGWWPTVTKKPTRISWLRVDFDKFKDPDESDDDFEMLNSPQRMAEREMDALTQQLLKENTNKPKSFSEKLSAKYLDRFWIEKGFAFRVATALQLLDVAHAAVGITKSSYQTALLQVVGRLFVLLVIDGDEELHTSRITFGLMVVYFLIEMFRYPYYALGCLKINLWVVTWLRYTAWIPLYPTGLLLEAITIYRAIPYYYTNTKYSIEMPNIFNIAFNFGVFLTVLLMFVFPFSKFHFSFENVSPIRSLIISILTIRVFLSVNQQMISSV
ncbi:unnamed protein product [Anisakis simplex]|uniref:Very-long-chain (3R)-3-hydroxyacyl-CoA dehydratase n=1 Tax=Anisakis simplex TaxID=6269 RepID=A0A158PPP2_ANISI|nr:unnamed protein product [Anisakis simplex]